MTTNCPVYSKIRGALFACGIVLASFFMAATAHAAKIIRDAEIETLLADYSRPLLLAADLDPKQVGIILIENRNLNAFVAAGQNIFFHTGLIIESDTPNMVIGVIAHEAGHIKSGHLAGRSAAIARAARPVLISTILGFGSLLAGAPAVGLALITGGQHIAQRSVLAYTRGQEAGADVVALQLLHATQQSPAGIIKIMDRFANQEVLNEVNQNPYARVHPMPRQRVSAYTEGAHKSPYFDKKDSPELQFRHDMARAKLYGFTDHPNTTFRRYRNDRQSAPARYALAIAYHRSAQTDRAQTLIDGLIAEFPNMAWLQELKGQIYYESGQAEKSIAPYKRAIALAPDEPLLLIGLAACQLSFATHNHDEAHRLNQAAEKNLRRALRLDPHNPTTYFQLSRAYGQLERVAHAQWALAEYYALLRRPEAKRHAKRALAGLDKSSPEYIRASDILNTPS